MDVAQQTAAQTAADANTPPDVLEQLASDPDVKARSRSRPEPEHTARGVGTARQRRERFSDGGGSAASGYARTCGRLDGRAHGWGIDYLEEGRRTGVSSVR